ncbi:hypothetical protein [Citrobacter portucalensis]|uniref:hypothetical protein n=1 Tax=Citrobacter portucalensis TaxID=1639133 RepID=UPI00226B9C88|nr:hypothetical protein [Citrobacter portucalensis]MCX8985938.1 hypothetical protein [Citrobacter portucalensis]
MSDMSIIPASLTLVNADNHLEPNINNPSSISRNIRSIRNVAEIGCVTPSESNKFHHPIGTGHGKKLETLRTHFNFERLDLLRKYVVSIDTKSYTQHGFGSSGLNEIKNAMDTRALTFERRYDVTDDKFKSSLCFSLRKQVGESRVELAHENTVGMNVESTYFFKMRVEKAADSVVFFQIRELGGDMNDPEKGKGQPVIALNIKNENIVRLTVSSSKERAFIRKSIATLDCPRRFYNFKVRVVHDREHPCIQIEIDGKTVFESNEKFGAHNSRSHYSKFGAYIPQQKNIPGVRDTQLIFDRFQEIHRKFNAKETS